jgi:hypothetical protein
MPGLSCASTRPGRTPSCSRLTHRHIRQPKRRSLEPRPERPRHSAHLPFRTFARVSSASGCQPARAAALPCTHPPSAAHSSGETVGQRGECSADAAPATRQQQQCCSSRPAAAAHTPVPPQSTARPAPLPRPRYAPPHLSATQTLRS